MPYNVTGIYIAGNKQVSENYMKPSYKNNFTQGTLYEVFVNVKIPFKADRADVDKWNDGDLNSYDGWIYGNFPNGNGELVVRESNQIKSATDNNGNFSTTDDHIQAAFAGSQLDFAHGVRKPEGKDVYLLSSAIMTQANTFEHFTEGLKDNTGSVVKRVILFGNNAYLWSTENGHEFFIEQSLTINEKNYDKINNLLSSYGTDEFTTTAINSIQRSKDKKARSRSLAEFAKRERSGENSGPVGQNSRRLSEVSNTSRNNGDSLANTERQGRQEIEKFQTPQGELYGFVDKDGKMYLDETVISPEHPIHEYTHLLDRAVRKKSPELWKSGRFHNTIDNKGRISYLCQGTKFGWL